MTSVLAVNTYYNLVVVADTRVTWKYQNGTVKLEDNLQKIYQFGPTGVIGFANNIVAAQAIFRRFHSHPLTALPSSAYGFVHYIAETARASFSDLSSADKKLELELMYAAVDYGRVYARLQNATLAENILVSFRSPNFVPIRHSTAVGLGYARQLNFKDVVNRRDLLAQISLHQNSQSGQLRLGIQSFGEEVARIAPIPVGGLFTGCLVQADGVGWGSYIHDRNFRIECNVPTDERPYQYIQYDLQKGLAIPLQSIQTYNSRRPSGGNLELMVPQGTP